MHVDQYRVSAPQKITSIADNSFAQIFNQTPYQPGLIRQIEEVDQARQNERRAVEQSLEETLTSNTVGQSAGASAGPSALTPLQMRAVTRQLVEMNLKNSLTVKTVAKTVEAFNQLARGG
jgi:hypothetical protein